MADTPIRRQITIGLELNPDGTPGELVRAFSRDEIIGRYGLELTDAINVTEETLAGLLPETAATIAQLASALEAFQAASRERDAAVSAAAADKQVYEAEIARLKALLAAGVPTPPPDNSIHAAYVKQALDDMKRIDEVVGAAIAAGYYQLWDNATSFTLEEPMVVAIANTLGIDLVEVRTRALAIRDLIPLSGNSKE